MEKSTDSFPEESYNKQCRVNDEQLPVTFLDHIKFWCLPLAGWVAFIIGLIVYLTKFN